MLGAIDAVANLAVKDLTRARKFYEGTLGLTPAGGEGDELAAYRSGRSTLYVYRSDYAGTNQATAVSWDVGGRIGEIVQALNDKGVRFEHYDMPGMTRDGDIHVGGGMRIAWFRDPDGNILSVAGK